MFIKVLLSLILLWDGYFFFNYLISLLKNYRIKEWTPFVSVLIPAYNEEKNVKKALLHALSQEYPSFEVILVDDGSEDGTFERASSIRDERLRIFRIEHGGKARALNFALSRARGDVIITTDADTQLEKDAVKELVKRLYGEEVLAAGGQVRVFNASFLTRAQDVEHLRIAMFRRAKEMEDLSVAPGPVSAFRREALERIGGFVESGVEDYATTKETKKFGKVVYAPRAKAFTEMPENLRILWEQRKRWFLGDLDHLGGGFLKECLFLLLGDFIALLDVLLPLLLILTQNWLLLVIFIVFEISTMLIPTLVEGGSLLNSLLFPVFLWFWAIFYLTLHLYGYFSHFVRKH